MTPDPARGSPLAQFLNVHSLPDYAALLARADSDPDWFWSAVIEFFALRFFTPYDRMLDLSDGPEWARWCTGGTTNLAYNCLDRSIARGTGSKPAILWEGEDGTRRTMTYDDLRDTVARVAGGLQSMGIRTGQVVGLFMPSVPEAIAAYLAVVSIGAIALPMFSGFGAGAVRDRLIDAGAVAVITADISYRRGKAVPMAEIIAEATRDLPALHDIIVVPRNGTAQLPAAAGASWVAWNTLLAMAKHTAPMALPAETPAMIVYTSGTTGKPKGTVHSHCGFMTKVALDFGLMLDLRPADRLLWMSDMGWLVGPMLAVAGPLVGATILLAEGVPDYPDPGRMWRLVQDHQISFLGVAPTTVRAFMQQPAAIVAAHDLSSIRVTSSTGEPWTPEAWTWFRTNICGGRAPILNYSGGTEIGGGILAGNILCPDVKPCGFAGPIPGMGASVVDESGHRLPPGAVGELALDRASIGLTRGLWNDPARYIESYWSRIPGLWIQGDFASVDADGDWFVHGRSDDTIKVAGKRTGPAEIEALLLATGLLAEAAAVGVPDPVKGAAVVCVCVLARDASATPATAAALESAVTTGLGGAFRPKSIVFVDDLPKTRSMKIMRRVVRAIFVGEATGDLSGMVNPEAVAQLSKVAGHP